MQSELHVAYTETHYTGDAIDPAAGADAIQYYRLRVPCEVQTYELTSISSAAGYFDVAGLRVWDLSSRYPPTNPSKAVVRKQYHELPNDKSRPCAWSSTRERCSSDDPQWTSF